MLLTATNCQILSTNDASFFRERLKRLRDSGRGS